MHPAELFQHLGEPGSGKDLSLVVSCTSQDVPMHGWLLNASGNVVGRLSSFRYEFVHFAPPASSEVVNFKGPPTQAPQEREVRFVHPRDRQVQYNGEWFDIGDYLVGTNAAAATEGARYVTQSERVGIKLHSHPWSGICEITVDGRHHHAIDLFNPSVAIARFVTLDVPAKSEVAIRATGRRNPQALGSQVILEGLYEYDGPLISPRYRKRQPINRGGEFHPRFFEILSTLPSDALVVDVGGGKRQIDDKRYVNLEYAPYEEADLLGDATALPFKSNSVDLIYTAAVMEHVTDPLKMGAEIVRVLKPGGVAIANSAFMQPIHSEGQHFFNATPYGLELAFSALKDKRVWWSGNLTDTLRWMLDVSGVAAKADAGDVDQFMSLSEKFDTLVGYERLAYIASSVWLEGRKA
jgi:SAM-dependent methyltransferase